MVKNFENFFLKFRSQNFLKIFFFEKFFTGLLELLAHTHFDVLICGNHVMALEVGVGEW